MQRTKTLGSHKKMTTPIRESKIELEDDSSLCSEKDSHSFTSNSDSSEEELKVTP